MIGLAMTHLAYLAMPALEPIIIDRLLAIRENFL